jgi:hypothetical protein
MCCRRMTNIVATSFIFPVREFAAIIQQAPISGGKHKVYLSRCNDDSGRWVLRRTARFDQITDETCLDMTQYRRNFDILN